MIFSYLCPFYQNQYIYTFLFHTYFIIQKSLFLCLSWGVSIGQNNTAELLLQRCCLVVFTLSLYNKRLSSVFSAFLGTPVVLQSITIEVSLSILIGNNPHQMLPLCWVFLMKKTTACKQSPVCNGV